MNEIFFLLIKGMTSQINNQFEPIQQLVAPSGVNIATNSSPSLSPIANSIVADVSNPGQLYVGNGTSWTATTSGTSSLVSASINLTQSGQTTLSNCTLKLQKLTVGSINMILFELNINQSPTVTATGTYTSPSGAVPAGYTPAAGENYLYFTGAVQTGNGPSAVTFSIQSNGTILLNYSGGTSIVVSFKTISCIYTV